LKVGEAALARGTSQARTRVRVLTGSPVTAPLVRFARRIAERQAAIAAAGVAARRPVPQADRSGSRSQFAPGVRDHGALTVNFVFDKDCAPTSASHLRTQYIDRGCHQARLATNQLERKVLSPTTL
jgi:hypothetical protein